MARRLILPLQGEVAGPQGLTEGDATSPTATPPLPAKAGIGPLARLGPPAGRRPDLQGRAIAFGADTLGSEKQNVPYKGSFIPYKEDIG